MSTEHKFNLSAPYIVLGMHDALVSLIGLIAGLTFAGFDRQLIILSAVISSVAAALSMSASCYLAEKTAKNPLAIRAGFLTGVAYIVTCIGLLVPFFIVSDTIVALLLSFGVVVAMIFGCNYCIHRSSGHAFWRHAIEMLLICTGVSIVAFFIGEFAKYAFNLTI